MSPCEEESTPYVGDCPAVFALLPLASNARHQARRTAGARHERTLFAVACMPLFGQALPRSTETPGTSGRRNTTRTRRWTCLTSQRRECARRCPAGQSSCPHTPCTPGLPARCGAGSSGAASRSRPFGPFLSMAAMIFWLYGEQITDLYFYSSGFGRNPFFD